MSASILGMGTALPQYSVPQPVAAEFAAQTLAVGEDKARKLKKLYNVTGVERRHSVLIEAPPGEPGWQRFFNDADHEADLGPGIGARMEVYEREAPKLAQRAAADALAEAGADAQSITHLVTVSCSGFFSPGADIELIKELGLHPTVERTHVGFMGCHGAINGMRVAMNYVKADPSARVLLVAVELCTLHYQYGWHLERNVANALFADGAAAMVVSDSGAQDAWRFADSGSCLIPESEYAMSWKIRDHGFLMTLSADVPRLICEHLRPWLDTWIEKRGWKLPDVASWAVHPGGPNILRATGKALGIARDELEVSWSTLKQYGNMSSPTVLFILDRLRRERAPRPCIALAFGPGLMAEAVSFE